MAMQQIKGKSEVTFTLSEIKEKYFPQWDYEILSAKMSPTSHQRAAQSLMKPNEKTEKKNSK